MPNLKVAFSQALVPSVTGLILGALSGWISIMIGDGVDGVGTIGARGYLVLALLLPAMLVYQTKINLSKNQKLYSSFGETVSIFLLIGILSTIIASALFLIPATNIPYIFKRFDTIQVREALYANIGWGKFAVVLATTIVVAVITAIWAHNQSKIIIAGK